MTSSKNLDGRFNIQGPLRCTGVGSLMCAQDKDGARTAIRVVPQYAQGGEAVAAILKFPLHPVLPRALGSGQLNDSSWVALDFPEGVLVTQKWPLDLQRLLAMGSAVASALAALHQANIVHGELSGDSVLVVPGKDDERFVLFDAPLVVMNRMTDRRGEERLLAQLANIVPFLSPERARGLEADFASDLWALGVVLSLAAGAKSVPGTSALEKIASIVTGKWRPSVPGTLPISLRLLLTRMLAPEPKARPSALDVAIELTNLQEALSSANTNPVSQARVDALVEKMQQNDPFAALVARGVSVNAPDAHAVPTKRMHVSQGDVTDPHAIAPVPTAPNGPEPTVLPLLLDQVADEASFHAISQEALLIPPLPARRRTPQPLPPILAPQAASPSPLPKVVAAPVPQTNTLRFGALPAAAPIAVPPSVPIAAPRPPPVQDYLETSPIIEATAELVRVAVAAPVRSIHDELEDAFSAQLARSRKRRFLAAGIAAGLLVVAGVGFVVNSQLDPALEEAADAAPVVQPAPVAAPAAIAAPKQVVAAEPTEEAPSDVDQNEAPVEPLNAAPAPAKVAPIEPAKHAAVEPTRVAPKPEQAKVAPAEQRREVRKPAPAPTRAAAPAPAAHKSASRLDEGD